MASEIAETLSISAVENIQTANYCKMTKVCILYKRRCGWNCSKLGWVGL